MKKWIKSKTLWINAIVIGLIIAKSELGFSLDPETEIIIIGVALGVVNMVLRLITKEEIVWTK